MKSTVAHDLSAQAMQALEGRLTIPAELEARILGRVASDLPAQAMQALAEQLAVPADLEARVLDRVADDLPARAMRELEGHLVVPADLEARLLDHVTSDAAVQAAAPASEARPRPTRPTRWSPLALVAGRRGASRQANTVHYGQLAAAAALCLTVAGGVGAYVARSRATEPISGVLDRSTSTIASGPAASGTSPGPDAKATALDLEVQAILAPFAGKIAAGVWAGTGASAPLVAVGAGRALPGASAAKIAILVELFSAYAGSLDRPLVEAGPILQGSHPALALFSPAERAEIRESLYGATPRAMGAAMMGSRPISDVVGNAAANVALALLGGPAAVTLGLHARDPAFSGVTLRRYLMAPRNDGDNEVTPESLAALLGALANRSVPGLDATAGDAVIQAMASEKVPGLGTRYFKDGNLDTQPLVETRAGFFVRDGAAREVMVYVVVLTATARLTDRREDDVLLLRKVAAALLAKIGAAAR